MTDTNKQNKTIKAKVIVDYGTYSIEAELETFEMDLYNGSIPRVKFSGSSNKPARYITKTEPADEQESIRAIVREELQKVRIVGPSRKDSAVEWGKPKYNIVPDDDYQRRIADRVIDILNDRVRLFGIRNVTV